MKPLLSKITTPFLLYVLIVLGVSIPVYYFVIDGIWKSELDEHNEIIVKKTTYELNSLKLSEDKLQASIALWNNIQPETNIHRVKPGDLLQDSVYTIENRSVLSSQRQLTDLDAYHLLFRSMVRLIVLLYKQILKNP
jgi:hypothetical protein